MPQSMRPRWIRRNRSSWTEARCREAGARSLAPRITFRLAIRLKIHHDFRNEEQWQAVELPMSAGQLQKGLACQITRLKRPAQHNVRMLHCPSRSPLCSGSKNFEAEAFVETHRDVVR